VDDQIWRRGPDKAGEQDRAPPGAAKETEQHRTLGRREDGREESHGERFGAAHGRRGADLPEAILNHGASVRANAAVTIRKRVPAGPTSKTDHRRKAVVARTIGSPSTRGMDQESSTDTGSRRPIPYRARSKMPAARPADHAAPRRASRTGAMRRWHRPASRVATGFEERRTRLPKNRRAHLPWADGCEGSRE
jgi:hypothetical protein